ncbi:MAG: ribosome recycling factor [Candidatus Melainabacteria bacterium RIFCSPHIGHO2_02_FULL_34_12]|nr:MAG: ribosome recycling factor [Candidatus Melainabacteria bacterium RIFCSPHIGHO2_02_FULL_34_12]
MQATDVMKNAEEQMKKAILLTQKELQSVRSGRANPALLDRVMVNYYGAPTPLKQVANISTPDGKCLVIQPYDKSSLKDIEIAINKSDIGMTLNNDGNVLRIVVPTLTEERRKELVKIIKKYAEDGKVAIRNARRDGLEAIKKLEKEKQVSEDESRKQQEHLQKITDKHTKEIDDLTASKEKEILSV